MSTQKYDCTVLIDASTSFIVEAGSPEEAAEKAELLAAEAGAGSLCHQCSDHTETGDFYGVMVYCDGADVLDTSYQSGQISKLELERDQLKAKLAELISAVRSINYSPAHKVMVIGDDEPQYRQRKEWIEWVLELCDVGPHKVDSKECGA